MTGIFAWVGRLRGVGFAGGVGRRVLGERIGLGFFCFSIWVFFYCRLEDLRRFGGVFLFRRDILCIVFFRSFRIRIYRRFVYGVGMKSIKIVFVVDR